MCRNIRQHQYEYYSILQLKPGCSESEIRHSYRQLVKKYHPDVCGGSEEIMSKINEAYEYLMDEDKRTQLEVMIFVKKFQAQKKHKIINKTTDWW